MKSVPEMKGKICLSVALLIIMLSTTAFAKVDFDEVNLDISDSKIETGENFEITIELIDPEDDVDEDDVDLEINFNGELVHSEELDIKVDEDDNWTYTLKSQNFKVDEKDEIFEKNLMNYICKEDIDVEFILSGGDIEEAEVDEITIEADDEDDKMYFDIDPFPILYDEDFEVTVASDDNDDGLNDAMVRFTWIDDEDGDDPGVWDIDDDSFEDDANSDGEVKFREIEREMNVNDAYGKYQLDIYKNKYCKITETFTIANALNISDPEPNPPQAGEKFKIKVLRPDGSSAQGVFVYMSPGGIRSSITSDGYASFTVTSAGSYSLTVGGSGTRYDETIKTIRVEEKSDMSLSTTPSEPKLNEAIKIIVRSDGEGVDEATVYVRTESGVEEKLSGETGSDGIIAYTPSKPGNLNIKVEKEGYESKTITVKVQNTFKVSIPDVTNLKKGDQVVVSVMDALGTPVSGADIIVGTDLIKGTTDPSGKFSFQMLDPGTYDLIVKKTGFTNYQRPLSSSGMLSVKLSHKELTLGEEIKITTTNSDGVPTKSKITVKGPKEAKSYTGSEVSFATSDVGEYSVSAEDPNYEMGKNSFTVKPKALSFTYEVKDGKIVINATSSGAAVANLNLKVEAGAETLTLTTDDKGMAIIENAKENINYTIISESPNYVKKQVSATLDQPLFDTGWIIPILIVLFVLVLLLIFVVVVVALLQRKKKGENKLDYRNNDRGGNDRGGNDYRGGGGSRLN